METYRNLGGDSGVVRYLISDDYIVVEFKLGDNKFYKYTYSSAGQGNVDEMKRLARAGRGLNSFIDTRVKHSYSSKSPTLAGLR